MESALSNVKGKIAFPGGKFPASSDHKVRDTDINFRDEGSAIDKFSSLCPSGPEPLHESTDLCDKATRVVVSKLLFGGATCVPRTFKHTAFLTSA